MNVRAMTLAGLAGAALFHGVIAAAKVNAGDDKTYTIVPKYVVGEVVKYKMSSNMKVEMTTESGQSPFPGGDMVMKMGMKYKTTKVDENGVATILMTNTGGQMSFMGQEMAMPQTPDITMEIDKRGLSKKISGLEKAPGMEGLQQMFNFSNMPSNGFFYPDHPVKVGETWDAELPSITGDKKMKVTCQLVSVDSVAGKDVYKVKQSWTIPMEMMVGQAGPTKNADEAIMVMSGEFVSAGDVLVAADTGRFTKLVSDVNGNMVMEMKGEAAQQSPFGSKMNIKLGGKAEVALAAPGEEIEAAKPRAAATKPVGAKTAGTKKPSTTAKPAKKP